MIVVLDSRRPTSVGLDVTLQLESFLENSRELASQCCVLGRAGAVETPSGLVVPTNRQGGQGKMVQVVCRGRPVSATDISCARLVDVQENVYGDGCGWKFLIDATLTATRIRDQGVQKIVILTTDLMLAGEDFEQDAAHFFSETYKALGDKYSGLCISLVFVEVVGPGTRSAALGASDSFEAWDKLERLRDWSKKGNFVLDLIDNKPAMFDGQLRCWLRDSSLRQACALRLPATETFSGVIIEVEITPYLLDRGSLVPHGPSPALHKGFCGMEVIQGVWLDTLDQGLCRGDPLLCVPAQLRRSPQQSQANRKLFTAVCAELNERDMGLLIAVRHPRTSLQERWLLLPQAPPSGPDAPALHEESSSREGIAHTSLVHRALLIRLATKEDMLEEGPTANISDTEEAECSVEKTAACASLEVLEKGTYNPLRHSSGLFGYLGSLQGRSNHVSRGPTLASRGSSRGPPAAINNSCTRRQDPAGSFTRRNGNRMEDQIQQQQQQRNNTVPDVSSSSSTTAISLQRSSGTAGTSTGRKASTGGKGANTGTVSQHHHRHHHQQPLKREVNLRYSDRPTSGTGAIKGRAPNGADSGQGGSRSSGSGIRRGPRFDSSGGTAGGVGDKGGARRSRGGGSGGRRNDDTMML